MGARHAAKGHGEERAHSESVCHVRDDSGVDDGGVGGFRCWVVSKVVCANDGTRPASERFIR